MQSPQSRLLTLAHDARRFALYNRWVIENAPCQTYLAALIFSPTQSLIRALFNQEEPSWISTRPIVESTWSPCLQTLEGHSGLVTSVAFSSDSKLVASGSEDETVKIWDVATGQEVQTLEGHSDLVRSVAFSSDSNLVASGSFDETVKIWDAATGQEVQTLEGHSGLVTSVAFSSDSKLVASGSDGGTVKVWDMTTGQEVQTLDVGDTISELSFDTSTPHLLTNIGPIRLDNTLASSIEAKTLPLSQNSPSKEYGVLSDRQWISWNGSPVLWLPPDFRPLCSATFPLGVTIGCRSGRVIIFRFSGPP